MGGQGAMGSILLRKASSSSCWLPVLVSKSWRYSILDSGNITALLPARPCPVASAVGGGAMHSVDTCQDELLK